MLVIHIVGGLGNQLYGYALYLMLKKQGKDVKLDIRDYLPGARIPEWRRLEFLQCCKEKPEIATDQECYEVLDDKQSFFAKVRRKLFGCHTKLLRETKEYDPSLFETETGYLDGYWNCDGYFQEDYPLLQSAIVFPETTDQRNRTVMANMEGEEAVAIHLRRTDYLKASCVERYQNICTDAYYQSALQYIKKHVKNPKLYVFSDDTEYAKLYFQREDACFVDWNQEENSLFDCMLMSKCKYHICANSTFSMWGARLSTREGKQMIRPLKNDNYEKFTLEERRSLWKRWILIDADGNVVS